MSRETAPAAEAAPEETAPAKAAPAEQQFKVVDPLTGEEVAIPKGAYNELGLTWTPRVVEQPSGTILAVKEADSEVIESYLKTTGAHAARADRGVLLGFVAVPADVVRTLPEDERYRPLHLSQLGAGQVVGLATLDSALPEETVEIHGANEAVVEALATRVSEYVDFAFGATIAPAGKITL